MSYRNQLPLYNWLINQYLSCWATLLFITFFTVWQHCAQSKNHLTQLFAGRKRVWSEMNMAFSTNDTFGEDFESPSASRHGTCRRCRKPARLICTRCEDNYCSKKCQDLDWKSHRYICFPKPFLLEIDAVPNDGENVPDLAEANPIFLAEQMRSMVNVCQDVLKQIDKTLKCNQHNIYRMSDRNLPTILGRKDFERNNNDIDDTIFVKNEEVEVGTQTLSIFNANDYYKKVQKSEATSKLNTNDSSLRTLDDNIVPVSKTDKKSSQYVGKKKKLHEPAFLMSNDTAVSAVLTENSTFDTCSTVSSNTGSENSDDEIVYLTSFRSANRVAVCPRSIVKDGFLNNIIDQVDKFGRMATKLTEMPEPESFVIALRSSKFARAKVLPQKECNTERIRLEFVDFGNLGFRRLSDLREILPALADLPILVSIVQLRKVELINYDDRILRFFSTFEKKYYKMKKIPSSTKQIEVELYDFETGDSMNQLIIEEFKKNENNCGTKVKIFKTKPHGKDDHSNTKPKQTKAKNKENLPPTTNRFTLKTDTSPVLTPPFKLHLFSRNARNIKAVILDTAMAEYGYIACIEQSNLVHLSKIQNILDKLVKSDEPYVPEYNEYVIAKFEDGAWYRGKITGISANKTEFEISYIDFLNMAKLTSRDIRRYPDDLTIDCYTTLCLLSDLPKKLSPALKEFLKTYFKVNDIITIDRVSDLKEDVAMIECNELVDRLQENDLL